MIVQINYKIFGKCVVQKFDTDAEYNKLKSFYYNGRQRTYKTKIFIEACKDVQVFYGNDGFSRFEEIERAYGRLEKYYAEIERHFLDFGD